LLAGFTQRKNLCQKIRAWGFMFFIQPVVTLALGLEEVFMCYSNVPSTYTTNVLRSFYVKKQLYWFNNFFKKCSQSGDQQYEGLAKFGYRQDMKVYFIKKHPAILWATLLEPSIEI
jgi:hypothetical protein